MRRRLDWIDIIGLALTIIIIVYLLVPSNAKSETVQEEMDNVVATTSVCVAVHSILYDRGLEESRIERFWWMAFLQSYTGWNTAKAEIVADSAVNMLQNKRTKGEISRQDLNFAALECLELRSMLEEAAGVK